MHYLTLYTACVLLHETTNSLITGRCGTGTDDHIGSLAEFSNYKSLQIRRKPSGFCRQATVQQLPKLTSGTPCATTRTQLQRRQACWLNPAPESPSGPSKATSSTACSTSLSIETVDASCNTGHLLCYRLSQLCASSSCSTSRTKVIFVDCAGANAMSELC